MKIRMAALLSIAVLGGCQTTQGVRQELPPAPTPPASTAPRVSDIVTPSPRLGSPTPISTPAPTQSPLAETASAPIVSLPPSGLAAFPQNAESISSPAVRSLLRKAEAARSAGQPAQASVALERALRIEPRNYFVWSALAGSYLDSKNYEQAESVARKSNSLARGNVYAELLNWGTIRDARAAQGNADGAAAAQAHVEAIQSVLNPPMSETASMPAAATTVPVEGQ